MLTHEQDMTLRHYQPASRSAWCGAKGRVIDRVAGGEVQDQYAVLKVPTTSDVNKVVCPECRRLILRATEHWR